MSKNKKITAGLILIATALLILMFTTMPSAGSKEMTISEIVKNGNKYEGEYLMTQGLLNTKSIVWDADKIELQFEIYDEENTSITVNHQGIKPDNFSDDVIVIVEGILNEKGIFEAEKVQTKCPSKYEGQDMENYDIDTHKKVISEEQE